VTGGRKGAIGTEAGSAVSGAATWRRVDQELRSMSILTLHGRAYVTYHQLLQLLPR
jgi:hypothetical protein